jgi:hypothetical protein
MSAYREVSITFNPDGTVELDQTGWKGQACDGAIRDLISALGKEVQLTKKPEYFQATRVQIRERE